MLKVLLLTNLYPTPQDSTRGVFNLQNFRALRRFCDARVVVPVPWWGRGRRPAEWWTIPQDESSGIPAMYPSFFSVPGVPALHARGMYASLRPSLRRLRAEFPFDVILASWAYPDAVAAAHFAEEIGCPLVTMILGSDLNEFSRHAALRTQIVYALNRSERVITVSGALKEKAVGLGVNGSKVVVQHNGVDGERFYLRSGEDQKEIRRTLGLPPDRPVAGYVGNFKPEKGVEVLIEAAGALKRRGRTEPLLALVGSGPLEEKMKSRVKVLGVEDQVRFCGRQPHDEIPRWMSASDVICLPSFREGCPNVVLEALASGKPVVASAVGGVPELIVDKSEGESLLPSAGGDADPEGSGVEVRSNGVLVPAGDPEALAAGIEATLARSWDPEALRDSVEFLSWDRFGQTLYGILEEAVGSGSRRSAGRRSSPAGQEERGNIISLAGKRQPSP
ncbi:MAG: glycosyltransferase family 4 protein [Armatimonadetes bacterium]|nr:glycosyltransferase family 4 protein [Armatimonadota bacterium]